MTSAMNIYVCTNQLLLGKSSRELLPELREFLVTAGLAELYDKAQRVKRVRINAIERMFINLLRTPDYAFNMTTGANKGALAMHQVAEAVRENNYDSDACVQWANYLITDIGSSTKGDYISNGVLYLTEKTEKANIDLEAAMKRAMAAYCWGCIEPVQKSKDTVKTLCSWANIEGDMTLTSAKFKDLLRSLVQLQISPVDVGEYVLSIPDLSVSLPIFHGVCYWSDVNSLGVQVVVPRGTSEQTIVAGNLVAADFLQLVMEDPTVVERARANGEQIIFPPQKRERKKVDV